MELYTARINYVGQGDELVLDTTYKTGHGLGATFAPSKKMVWDYKKKRISWEEYTDRYLSLMRERYRANAETFHAVLAHPKVVLKCYCADKSNSSQECHRYLLVALLVKVALQRNVKAKYKGEKR